MQVALVVVALGALQLTAERTNRRVDLTPGRTMSLSPVTRRVLGEVAAPLRMTIFYRRGTRERYADLAARLPVENRLVSVDLVDLDRHPERAEALGVTTYGRAALEYEGRRAVVPALSEEALAGGVLQVVRGRARRIVFTAGHGERAPAGGQDAYGRLVAALEAENYAPEGVSLVDGPVPADAELVVVAGPRHDFLLPELEALATYLKRGGGVLLLLEPGRLPLLAGFLGTMGIRLGNDFLVDRDKRVLGTDGAAAVIELFKRGNPISDAIDSGVVLPSARTVDVREPVSGVHAESIARTAATAWAMADPDRARRGDAPSEAAHDVPGAASVVVMAEVGGGDRRAGRLVVVGDADFASDAYLDLLGNRDLALNAVSWLAGEPALGGERTKERPEVLRPLSPLVLTTRQARTLFVAGVVVEPALVLLAGAVATALARRG